MRLDQFLSKSCNVSRKQAKALIKASRVTVDDTVGKSAQQHIDNTSIVQVDGNVVSLPQHQYIMLNKPAGYVSVTVDDEHPTALSLIAHEQRENLHIAGRLDKDTTGLLLLTSDGQWSRKVSAPRYETPKTYIATLARPLTEEALQQLRDGILLRNDSKPTAPAKVTLLTENRVQLTITEGRYHQVKRMLAAVGNHVSFLHRQGIGNLTLKNLAEGEYRQLSETEVQSFM